MCVALPTIGPHDALLGRPACSWMMPAYHGDAAETSTKLKKLTSRCIGASPRRQRRPVRRRLQISYIIRSSRNSVCCHAGGAEEALLDGTNTATQLRVDGLGRPSAAARMSHDARNICAGHAALPGVPFPGGVQAQPGGGLRLQGTSMVSTLLQLLKQISNAQKPYMHAGHAGASRSAAAQRCAGRGGGLQLGRCVHCVGAAAAGTQRRTHIQILTKHLYRLRRHCLGRRSSAAASPCRRSPTHACSWERPPRCRHCCSCWASAAAPSPPRRCRCSRRCR